ncbi:MULTISPECIES: NAD+ synthase [Halocynthiibacter]|uniref:Glutamine-dependent NAD(+) synthetase n=1 Tax=Halocynthiibacter halioticoli TaxID=2986804 RepID=A0AAE3IWQ5_9RHOB|nr:MULTISPECIES: NAD+ synthase [Halocynthiibacter]MCV6823540.1 NAD+ synthase [Halocynthiibacter halioticoli]MCW4056541.1 NAD+ synthase [Halocynthiibacter sp. SDUM655004]
MTFRLTLAQLNPTVGDINGNIAKARAAWEEARAAKADMLALPEMFSVGYQTQDLVRKPAFFRDAMAAIEGLAKDCADGPVIGIGGPYFDGEKLFNAYYILSGGVIAHRALKTKLPNETVFDEKRLFAAGEVGAPYQVGPLKIGSPICEDSWHHGVAESLAAQGAEILLVPNGSPYYRDKFPTRLERMRARVNNTGLPLVYLNMVGGQDDQVFDGSSFTLGSDGALVDRMGVFAEELRHLDFKKGENGWSVVNGEVAPRPDAWEQDYHVMVLSLRDYMAKTGFKKVLFGLSGGIDSAIVATIAVDALGAENVRCVMLPSEYTSQGSLDDAEAVAKNLGCHYDYVPIAEGRAAITNTLAPFFEGMEPGLTEENIQSRLRGLLLMAMSNKFGEMLLTTGNKSEVAVGYATIYGDMAGGYNPIKDLYKTRVFEQCRWRNANHRDWMKGPEGEVIPVSIIDKPPSAELRPDQKDEDSLPPYEVLDAILHGLVDEDLSVADLVAQGFERETVKRVEHLIYISEYKRFQSAPGARLTKGAFWLDRRYPIVNRWRDGS